MVVVGGGLAGLSAALEALHLSGAEGRVQITVMEKEHSLGGTTVKEAGGIRWASGAPDDAPL